ncbi:MAG: hypothetical protein P8N51_19155 [Pseudomonadales bacterium]|jgi:hypothetical protein|nr:hypothetical protein [Pseudomonadales bacterium]MDG1441579.1 hypothetical protein [Pseudomonadales bacterium]
MVGAKYRQAELALGVIGKDLITLTKRWEEAAKRDVASLPNA